MPLDVTTGWKNNGILTGKRGFRDPKEIPEFDIMNFFLLLPFYLITILYALFLSIKDTLARNIWAKPLSLKGKVCLVTGSGRGLGRQICLDLAGKGAKVACAEINEETNSETIKMLTELGATAKAYKLNVSNRDEVFQCVKKVEEDLGPIYLVVNNAAILLPPAELSEDYVRATFNVNTFGPIWVTEAVLAKFEERNSGHIVNIASISSFYPVPTASIYSATKAALRSFTHSTNMELRSKGSDVKVTCISPTVMNSSADYAEMLFPSKRNKPISIRSVSDAVMDAVTYGIEDITLPRTAKIGCLLFQFMPVKAVTFFYGLTNTNVTTPTKEEYAMLPCGDLVRACSKSGDVTESRKENRPSTKS